MGNWNPEVAAPVAAASLLALSILMGLEWRMGAAAAEVEPSPGALTDFDLEAKGGPGGMGALNTPEEEFPGWTDRDLMGCREGLVWTQFDFVSFSISVKIASFYL